MTGISFSVSNGMNFKEFSSIDIVSVVKMFSVDPARGLSLDEVVTRRAQYGKNILTESNVRAWKVYLRQFKSSFVYLLFVAAAISFALGEVTEGWMILLFLGINTTLGFFQEYRSEQTVELLRRYISTKATVRRGGAVESIDAGDLVPGDIILLKAGDSVPADIRIISEVDLTINEEPLTGESVPVKKESAPLTHSASELYEAKNIGFSGTTVISGHGVGIVFAVGVRTMIGDIARITGATARPSKFEEELGKFSKFILYLVIATLFFIFAANLILKGFRADIASLAIFSIALAVSVVPEALPLVMTFSLSRGARDLAKNRVVVKRLSAIEDLGSIEVLCTDKTGTITENKLTVHETYPASSTSATNIITAATMCSSYLTAKEQGETLDPFDVALLAALSEHDRADLATCKILTHIPFDPVRKKNSVVVAHHGTTKLLVRGATEAILERADISPDERTRILSWVAEEGRAGRRTLAIASKEVAGDGKATHDDTHLAFIGCISFIDPIKTTARNAIARAIKMNVGIKIITGDSKEVAGTVAHSVGLAKDPGEVVTAHELFALPEQEILATLERINVFARVSPEEKYKIIELLQKKYQVGFLGEGINDAPALKIANVAIVVDSASDIAREASDIILLERSLSVIIDGIREGRAIFANTMKYIRNILSSNFGNFYSVAVSSLFIDFLPMLPLQILLVNLLSDFPAVAIATDNVDPEELREPKQYNVRRIIIMGTILGLVSTIFDFIIFAVFYRVSPEALQTHWFIESILTELVLLYSIRSRSLFFRTRAPSFTLGALSFIAALVTITLPFTEVGHSLFRFISPTAGSLGIVLGIVATYFVTTETAKLLYYRLATQPSSQN